MTLSQAKALLRGPVHHELIDAPLLARTLRWLAVQALRFTPRVGLESPDGLCLDIAGCTHLFGGECRMAERVERCFRRAGFEARAAVAPVPAAAWAFARFGAGRCRHVESAHVRDALASLPIEAARLPIEQELALQQVGIVTIAQLLKVPRAELARRYGCDVPQRLDRLLGREVEAITPIRTRAPLGVGRMFAGPTDRTESIALCVRQLLQALYERLASRESGCRELIVTLLRSDMPPVEVVARASHPTRDARHWYALLVPKLEQAHLGFGVEGVTIGARSIRTLRHVQSSRWLETSRATDPDELARLADTLMARLGPDQVVRMRERESHIPEHAHMFETAEAPGGAISHLPSPDLDRPSLLLAEPMPLDVVFLFPDGPIGSVRRDDETHTVITCRGPERICGEWWQREHGTRDYYQLQLEDGAWLWAFRSVESGRWFLHGEWA